jgi:hypothetical protein
MAKVLTFKPKAQNKLRLVNNITHKIRPATVALEFYGDANNPKDRFEMILSSVESFIKSITSENPISLNKILMRRKGLRVYDTESLTHEVLNSSQDDWNRKPGYYLALIEELRDRKVPPPTKP